MLCSFTYYIGERNKSNWSITFLYWQQWGQPLSFIVTAKLPLWPPDLSQGHINPFWTSHSTFNVPQTHTQIGMHCRDSLACFILRSTATWKTPSAHRVSLNTYFRCSTPPLVSENSDHFTNFTCRELSSTVIASYNTGDAPRLMDCRLCQVWLYCV